MKLQHGGDLAAAAGTFGIPRDAWLDLSTGVNPRSWPVPPLPATTWSRLPCLDDDLVRAAADYYGCNGILPVPGSQFAIQTLPGFFPVDTVVAIPRIGYQEHLAAWRGQGMQVRLYDGDEVDVMVDDAAIGVIILINPNNPGCRLIARETVQAWLERLGRRNAWMIIDEAFMDATQQQSLAGRAGRDNLIVLRSLGKFFGLAGVRLGFTLAAAGVRDYLQERLGPWAVSGPAQWIGIRALADRRWQQRNREWLGSQSRRLTACLQQRFPPAVGDIGHTALFATVNLSVDDARFCYQQLGQAGILVRLVEHDSRRASLRFGLPDGEQQWTRFERALDRTVGTLWPAGSPERNITQGV